MWKDRQKSKGTHSSIGMDSWKTRTVIQGLSGQSEDRHCPCQMKWGGSSPAGSSIPEDNQSALDSCLSKLPFSYGTILMNKWFLTPSPSVANGWWKMSYLPGAFLFYGCVISQHWGGSVRKYTGEKSYLLSRSYLDTFSFWCLSVSFSLFNLCTI